MKILSNMASAVLLTALFLVHWPAHAQVRDDQFKAKFDEGTLLYNQGFYARAEQIFTEITLNNKDAEAEGYKVLCAVRLNQPNYQSEMAQHITDYPYSSLLPQIRFYHALNCFNTGDYASAAFTFEKIKRGTLYKPQRPEYDFDCAYCDFKNGVVDRALDRFEAIAAKDAEYDAESHYFAGYILYSKNDFAAAEKHFAAAAADARFKSLAGYYLVECRFMQKDYEYVVEKGPEVSRTSPVERQKHLSRIISEAYLVLGEADKARGYYVVQGNEVKMSDEDLFYSGSVLYAVGDWSGAAENFSKMENKVDSIGQIGSYHLASCYLNLKNKVAAFSAFKAAASSNITPSITEDAMYNHAKLAFDLYGDITPFERYLSIYSDGKRGDEVYSYVAMGFLKVRDYASAVDAYDKIDYLAPKMRSNYMKANYLRAVELIKDDSWRAAIPCLKAAGYYSNKREGFNQLSRFWLAEAYFRTGQYDDALALDLELYNSAALYGTAEANLITYNIAYAYFQKGDYPSAAKWFDQHLASGCTLVKKEALVRLGDCFFQQASYSTALKHYLAAYEYDSDVNDIYPYYYAGLAYGLVGRNQLKISTLEPVLQAESTAAYYPEALCELGVTYSRTGDDAAARKCFNQLIASTSNSTYQSMALIELGTLAMKQGRASEAKTYYKRVVEDMPASTYTDDALLALESVYRSENDPQGYLSYLDGIGKAGSKSDAEREEMIFNAAEQVFISGNYAKALTDFEAYLQAYPAGEKRSSAQFYIGESYRMTGSFEKAIDSYSIVMESGYGAFLELAILHYAELSYKLQQYSAAYSGYDKLFYRAQIDSNKYLAQLGMMRSGFYGKMYENAVSAAAVILNSSAASDAEKAEAAYIQAKSYHSMSDREKALPLLEDLARNPSNAWESEAAFLLIQDCYDRAEFESVEAKVFAFSDAKNPDEYWLAKSFVVLGDAYAEQGELEQAKATFESVRDGYQPDNQDDVKEDLDLRIQKIEQVLNK